MKDKKKQENHNTEKPKHDTSVKVERENLKDDAENIEEHENIMANEKEVDSKKTNSAQEIEERIKELEEKNRELNDRLLRRLAEFENYKKRTEQDQMNLLKYAAEPFIMKIIPVYDDLNRSLNHLDEANSDSLRNGLKMVVDKFTRILEDQGITRIEAKGKQFDFNYHEALMQQEAAGVPSHTVLEEIEPGYIYKDRVLKHAKVIVSQESTEPKETEKGSEDKN